MTSTLPRAATPQVKGLAFHTVLAQVERLCGDDAVKGAVARLPEEVRDAWGGGSLVAAGWYPIAWYRALWRAVEEETRGGHALVRRIGRDALFADISRVYRHFLRLLSPKTIASLGAKYFDRFYDTGGFRVQAEDANKIAARFQGCRGFDRNMWIEVAGSIEAFVELAGVKDVAVHVTAGGHDDDDWAEIVARWS